MGGAHASGPWYLAISDNLGTNCLNAWTTSITQPLEISGFLSQPPTHARYRTQGPVTAVEWANLSRRKNSSGYVCLKKQRVIPTTKAEGGALNGSGAERLSPSISSVAQRDLAAAALKGKKKHCSDDRRKQEFRPGVALLFVPHFYARFPLGSVFAFRDKHPKRRKGPLPSGTSHRVKREEGCGGKRQGEKRCDTYYKRTGLR